MRLDIWLDVACLFKTRSEATRACKAGRVDVNGQGTKPHRELKVRDEIEISRPFGRRQKVIVLVLADKHVPKAEARLLYEDITPKPTPEELEMQRMGRMVAPFSRPRGAGAPDRRERKALNRLKGRS